MFRGAPHVNRRVRVCAKGPGSPLCPKCRLPRPAADAGSLLVPGGHTRGHPRGSIRACKHSALMSIRHVLSIHIYNLGQQLLEGQRRGVAEVRTDVRNGGPVNTCPDCSAGIPPPCPQTPGPQDTVARGFLCKPGPPGEGFGGLAGPRRRLSSCRGNVKRSLSSLSSPFPPGRQCICTFRLV